MAGLGEPRDPKGFFQSKPCRGAEKPNQPCPSPEGVFWKLPSVPVGVALQHPGGCIPHTPTAIPIPLSCHNKRAEAQHLQIHTPAAPGPKQGLEIPPKLAAAPADAFYHSQRENNIQMSIPDCLEIQPSWGGTDGTGQKWDGDGKLGVGGRLGLVCAPPSAALSSFSSSSFSSSLRWLLDFNFVFNQPETSKN